jgi:hypothetical protein
MKMKKQGHRGRSQTGSPLPGRAEPLIPGTRAFREEAHRQSLAIARSPDDAEDQRFVDAIAYWPEE